MKSFQIELIVSVAAGVMLKGWRIPLPLPLPSRASWRGSCGAIRASCPSG